MSDCDHQYICLSEPPYLVGEQYDYECMRCGKSVQFTKLSDGPTDSGSGTHVTIGGRLVLREKKDDFDPRH